MRGDKIFERFSLGLGPQPWKQYHAVLVIFASTMTGVQRGRHVGSGMTLLLTVKNTF